MNIVLCVATYGSFDKISGLIASVYRCYGIAHDFKCVVINTGDDFGENKNNYFDGFDNLVFFKTSSTKRFYASVMFLKIMYASKFCNDDTIFINTDDDYFFNEHTIMFAKKLFEENDFVNYASFLKGPGMIFEDKDLINLSGQRFYKTGSCMGGAMMVRWKNFHPSAMEFFNKYGVSANLPGEAHHFDIPYWQFLEKSGEYSVYTLYDFSLVQQCNLGSNYREEKGPLGNLAHMYGLNFDPRLNPLEFKWSKGND